MTRDSVGRCWKLVVAVVLQACLPHAVCGSDTPFNQPPPIGSPAVFAPGVVSVEGRYEYAVSFAPGGDEVLFSAEAGSGAKVYHSRRDAGEWSVPREVNLSQSAQPSEMEAFFSPDGKHIYFAAYKQGMDVRIWVLDRDGADWSSPRMLPEPLASTPAFYPTVAGDGTLYYTDLAARGIARATYDGVSLSSVTSVPVEQGGHAFIDPGGDFMLLDSASPGGGGRDIFVVFAEADGQWSRRIRLGGGVNSEYSETCPSLSADGKYLYFSRYDEADRKSNIYWVSAGVIEAARDKLDQPEAARNEIETAIRDCFLWAVDKDRPRLEKLIAKDENYFSWHPGSMEPIVGRKRFEQNFETWMDPRFKAAGFDLRDLRINLSESGTVAWFSGVLDDCFEWDGEPGCWKETRWTGVLELRNQQWTIVQMHFSFPADRFKKASEQEN